MKSSFITYHYLFYFRFLCLSVLFRYFNSYNNLYLKFFKMTMHGSNEVFLNTHRLKAKPLSENA